MSTLPVAPGPVARPRANQLWAITCYFNPVGYKCRLANYRLFRRRLKAPLVTVEMAYGSRFELSPGDADILLQIPGGDVLWQKERLLNMALGLLPGECDAVAWLDCDVVFADDRWPDQVCEALRHHAYVQPFRHVHHLTPLAGDDFNMVERSRASISYLLMCGHSIAGYGNPESTAKSPRGSWGLAGAARRDLLQEHGFYDAAILGSGDLVSLCAAHGRFQEAMWVLIMNEWQREHYLAWAKPFRRAVNGNVAAVQTDLFHLWHGNRENRNYRNRHCGLAQFQFNPFADIALDPHGCWRWNTSKPDMHALVRNYFSSRKEDG